MRCTQEARWSSTARPHAGTRLLRPSIAFPTVPSDSCSLSSSCWACSFTSRCTSSCSSRCLASASSLIWCEESATRSRSMLCCKRVQRQEQRAEAGDAALPHDLARRCACTSCTLACSLSCRRHTALQTSGENHQHQDTTRRELKTRRARFFAAARIARIHWQRFMLGCMPNARSSAWPPKQAIACLCLQAETSASRDKRWLVVEPAARSIPPFYGRRDSGQPTCDDTSSATIVSDHCAHPRHPTHEGVA